MVFLEHWVVAKWFIIGPHRFQVFMIFVSLKVRIFRKEIILLIKYALN